MSQKSSGGGFGCLGLVLIVALCATAYGGYLYSLGADPREAIGEASILFGYGVGGIFGGLCCGLPALIVLAIGGLFALAWIIDWRKRRARRGY